MFSEVVIVLALKLWCETFIPVFLSIVHPQQLSPSTAYCHFSWGKKTSTEIYLFTIYIHFTTLGCQEEKYGKKKKNNATDANLYF